MEGKDFYLQLEGINLKGQVYYPETGQQPFPTLCICHGLPRGGAATSNDRGYPALAERFSRAGFLTLIFNFRGAGESEGNFDIMGWTRDLTAVLDYVYNISAADKSRIATMGFSAGAAVCIYVASRDPRVASVISCGCPTVSRLGNSRDLALQYIAEFRKVGIIKDDGFPPSLEEWMGNFNYIYSLNWVEKLSPKPLLIMHGTQDDVVPVDSSMALYEHAGKPKDIFIIQGAGHQLRLVNEAMENALNWLKSLFIGD
jgi:alpha/beta superfamily hydrolase